MAAELLRSADGTLLQASGWICQVTSDPKEMKWIAQSPVHTHTVRSDLRHVFLLLSSPFISALDLYLIRLLSFLLSHSAQVIHP